MRYLSGYSAVARAGRQRRNALAMALIADRQAEQFVHQHDQPFIRQSVSRRLRKDISPGVWRIRSERAAIVGAVVSGMGLCAGSFAVMMPHRTDATRAGTAARRWAVELGSESCEHRG